MYESFTTPQLEETFHTHSSTGLSSTEADERLRQSGENILKKGKDQTILDMIMEQLNDPMIFILFMAAAISMLLRQFSDTAIIFVVIALNTTVGVIQEGRAKKAMDALKKMTAPSAVVKRDGIYKKIPASFVVPGDWSR